MTSPLRRIAASLTGLAVGIVFFAATFTPSGADAQSTAIKRAAPPAKAHGKSAARTPSSWVPNPAVNGKDAYLILDATSGRELVADRADELRHPASLTKLMTIYLAFSALDSGRLSLGDALPVSINALNAPPTKIGLPPSGTVNVRDAIMALVTRSANDAAVVIAEALGGDEASFAQLMTRKARQLGMSSTVYRNASGLPNREQVTTARDLARLAFALMRDFPHYYAIFSVQSYPYHGRILENAAVSQENVVPQNRALNDGVRPDAAIGADLCSSEQLDEGLNHGVGPDLYLGIDDGGLRTKDRHTLCHQLFCFCCAHGGVEVHHLGDGIGPQHLVHALGRQRDDACAVGDQQGCDIGEIELAAGVLIGE